MAFEITHGTFATGSANQLIDKVIELYESFFDSVDQESQYHSATYGSATISTTNGANIILKDGNGTTLNTISYNAAPYFYNIVKASDALLINFLSSADDNASYGTVVFGTLKNIDGTTGKGAIIVKNQATAAASMVAGQWSSGTTIIMQEDMRQSDGLTQLIPYAATVGGWYFDNAYRMMVGTAYNNRGVYLIGDDRYYISQRTAIKEE
jgi:hypothetical protein